MEDGSIAITNKMKADTFESDKIHQINYDPNHNINTETEINFLDAHKEVYQQLKQGRHETEDDHSMLREMSVNEITKTFRKC